MCSRLFYCSRSHFFLSRLSLCFCQTFLVRLSRSGTSLISHPDLSERPPTPSRVPLCLFRRFLKGQIFLPPRNDPVRPIILYRATGVCRIPPPPRSLGSLFSVNVWLFVSTPEFSVFSSITDIHSSVPATPRIGPLWSAWASHWVWIFCQTPPHSSPSRCFFRFPEVSQWTWGPWSRLNLPIPPAIRTVSPYFPVQ